MEGSAKTAALPVATRRPAAAAEALPIASALQDAVEVEILRQALRWHEEGRPVAIATVVGSWGSAPRPIGSKLAVAAAGEFTGSVSGGCVENAVITAALDCIADGAPRLLDYEGDAKWPWDVGLPCGGTIRVYVEPLSAKYAAALQARDQGRVTALVTNLATGGYTQMTAPTDPADADAAREAQEILPASSSEWRTGLISAEGGDLFIEVHRPSLRLMIIGATHLAQSLSAMAALYGYDVTVIDPRAAYLTAERFGAKKLVPEPPGEALQALAPDAATAVIVVSHDPKIDDPGLIVALRSAAFYIGALGSRKAHDARLERLRAAGFDDAALARIHGPVGLAIGAVSPPEIAGSILAQLTQVLHGKA
jgi:xanthine dehydrogenase accessory factor